MLSMVRKHIIVTLLFYFTVACVGLGIAEPLTLKPAGTSNISEQKTKASGELGGRARVPAAIEWTDVAVKAAEVDKLLSMVPDKLPLSLRSKTINRSLSEVSSQIVRDLEATNRVLSRNPSLPVLQDQQQIWQRTELTLSGWLEILTRQSETNLETLTHLENLETTWTKTLTDAHESNAPEFISLKIVETIGAIHASQTGLKEQLARVLDLQTLVEREIAKCEAALTEIADMRQNTISDILIRDSLPAWSPELWSVDSSSLKNLQNAAILYGKNLTNTLFRPYRYNLLFGAILIVLVFLFVTTHYQVRKWTASGNDFSPFIRIFDYPVAAALTVSLLTVTTPYRSLFPGAVRETLQVLSMVPVIILVKPEVPARFRPLLYALGFLFLLDTIRDILFAGQLPGQLFLTIESLGSIVVTVWFLHKLRTLSGSSTDSTAMNILQTLTFSVLLLLVSSFAAVVSGHVRLTRIITPGVISFSVMAMAMYAALRILIGFIAFAFHVWPLKMLHMVQRHRPLLERRIYKVLLCGAATGLIVRHLGYIGLLEPALATGKSVLSAKLVHGTLNIFLSDVVYFALTVWATYLLSSFIRFVLREDIYPRIQINRGKSFAVSSLLHYTILVLGFTVAIGVLGVDLTKFSVLTGALGIGIGFGLQGVMKNFVSGLILLFERPIQVGDTVEVENLLGKVRKIGIRASTVRTRQGSDIIVPNSQLVTEKVTNWTLGDQMKRIDLPVGVSYDSSPKAVIDLLSTVADRHPDVLKEPSPRGLFVGFGESSINFELRVWTEYIDDWPRVRSELAEAVYDAVRGAGLTFPFPQRVVRLLNDSESDNGAAVNTLS